MVLDGLRGYLQLASGLTDVTRERARAAARALVAQSGAGVDSLRPVTSQVSTITEDLLATSKANRDLLLHLVRGEVERSVARLGLVSRADLEAERRRGDRLEAKVRELETKATPATRSAASSTAKKSAARKSAVKKSAATTSTARKSTAKKKATTTRATKSAAPTTGTGS